MGKVVYLDCASGVSGDMMLGALIDAGVDLATIQTGIDSLGLPSCQLVTSEVTKRGFRATQLVVQHTPQHAHRHLGEIVAKIDQSQIAVGAKDLAKRMFAQLANAEAKVHGTTPERVHFHEVGAVDSIADIVGTAIAWELLGADRAVASPVPTGHGTLQIAHGRCSIPAPATAELLRGVPLAESPADGELTTPTGAVIVATLADDFGPLPEMRITEIGYGAGQRDYASHPNLLRLLVGTTQDGDPMESVWVVATNLDDISGELIGYCTERLLEAGALDVWTTAIQMKKNRPAVELSVLCRATDLRTVETILFRETTTLGLRRWPVSRSRLDRAPHGVETSWGQVQGIRSTTSTGQVAFAPEFESCRQVAALHAVPLKVVYAAAVRAFVPEGE